MRRCSVDAMPEGREGRPKTVLTELLRLFARQIGLPELTDEQRYQGVLELYEKGYLKIVRDGDRFKLVMCSPDEAPQLLSPTAAVVQ
jgi:hypothetical protein